MSEDNPVSSALNGNDATPASSPAPSVADLPTPPLVSQQAKSKPPPLPSPPNFAATPKKDPPPLPEPSRPAVTMNEDAVRRFSCVTSKPTPDAEVDDLANYVEDSVLDQPELTVTEADEPEHPSTTDNQASHDLREVVLHVKRTDRDEDNEHTDAPNEEALKDADETTDQATEHQAPELNPVSSTDSATDPDEVDAPLTRDEQKAIQEAQRRQTLALQRPDKRIDGLLKRKSSRKGLLGRPWKEFFCVLDPDLWSIRLFSNEQAYFHNHEDYVDEITLQQLQDVFIHVNKRTGRRFDITTFDGTKHEMLAPSVADMLKWYYPIRAYKNFEPRLSVSGMIREVARAPDSKQIECSRSSLILHNDWPSSSQTPTPQKAKRPEILPRLRKYTKDQDGTDVWKPPFSPENSKPRLSFLKLFKKGDQQDGTSSHKSQRKSIRK